MSTFIAVFNPVLTMIIPFFIGMLYYKLLKPDASFSKNIASYLFNISYLATAFNAIINADFSSMSSVFLKCMILGTVFYLACYPLGLFLSKFITKEKKKRAVLTFSTIFPNFVFMAYPVITMLFGADKLIYAASFNLCPTILMLSLGVFIISDAEKEDASFHFSWSYIINPPMIATMLAVLLKLCSVTLYAPITQVVNLFDGTTSILSMFMGGMLLIRSGILNSLKSRDAYIISAVRLLLLPIILAILCKWIGLTEEVTLVLMLIIAMPVANNCVMYTENFKISPDYATGIVFISCILSLITCPLIFLLVKAFIF